MFLRKIHINRRDLSPLVLPGNVIQKGFIVNYIELARQKAFILAFQKHHAITLHSKIK